jgi:hypothetical protein
MGSKLERAMDGRQTYTATAQTRKRRGVFRAESGARLFIGTLDRCPGRDCLLYQFVVTADRVLLLIAPLTSLERAVQYVPGGYSDGAKRELGANVEVRQTRDSSHRVRGDDDHAPPAPSIEPKLVTKQLAMAEEDVFSSAHLGFELVGAPGGGAPFPGPPRTSDSESFPLSNQDGNKTKSSAR